LVSNIVLMGCVNEVNTSPKNENVQQTEKTQSEQIMDPDQKEVVVSLIEEFGRKLQLVSLLAPEEVLKESIQKNYKDFLSPSLLKKWLNNPKLALGRKVSSPWPDRIEILDIKKSTEQSYEASGEIIEIISGELENGGSASKYPILLRVKKVDDRWMIDEVNVDYAEENDINYTNNEYGFTFSLPASWAGYQIVMEKWEGNSLKHQNQGGVVETGPMILIRHPEWKLENPRQDIPIMVFTHHQWNSLQQGEFHIGAAPIGPKELGRNHKYVFALPARYNYAFPPGYEEVEKIIESGALQPIDK
jgi:hypothetical protein